MRETIVSYFQLMKPGIMVLLVLEAITAMIVAAGRFVQPIDILWLAVAGMLGSGGSAALNQYLERNKDAMMSRTDSRPVATSRIAPKNALIFGLGTLTLGLAVSYFIFNILTMLMILLGALTYIFLYTLYLKPRTMWNIVIGGVAGVFPALAGWAAVTGFVQWPAIYIGLLVFLWTPPHFWGLSMKFKEDYRKTGYPMLAVVKNERQVIHWIVYSSIPLFAFSVLPFFFPLFGSFNLTYYLIAGVMAAAFIVVDIKMLRHPTIENGFKAFLISLPYLFVIFGAMIVSAII